MTRDMAERFVDAAGDVGCECSIYEAYSGRGMYGKTTVGIMVGNMSDMFNLCMVAGYRAGAAGVEPVNCNFRTDNMGHDIIVY